MIQLINDEQILDEKFRRIIIDEINGTENVKRKEREAAKWEIWHDGVKPFVMERLEKQGFKAQTLEIMKQRASNVNLFKKIVSKKARSYSKGVNRSIMTEGGTNDDRATKDLEAVCTAMGLTQAMKRLDKFRQGAKNGIGYIYPEKVEHEGKMLWSLRTKTLYPHLYDVIPDAADHEKPKCFILSPFANPASAAEQPSIGSGDGRNIGNYANPAYRRDMREQTIANAPRDTGAQKREYVWWTAKYHFTTDDKGQIIPEKSGDLMQVPGIGTAHANPIQRLPIFNISTEQDGEFWALGGDDLVDGTVLLNIKLTDMEAILHMQGWGQLVVKGQDLKKKDFQVGPQVALLLETEAGAVHETSAEILSHDPHTDDHLKSAEVHVALLLTTNNLSVKSVSTNLQASGLASALAKLVDEAEVLDDITEDQEYYGGKEKEAVRIASSWVEKLKPTRELIPSLQGTNPIQADKMITVYHKQEQVVTEAERLANLEKRQQLGIDTAVDLIKKDNPGMTDAQAEKKLLQIVQEREKSRAALTPVDSVEPQVDGNGNPIATTDAGAAEMDVRKETLNGAQIESVIELNRAVAAQEISRSAAVAMMMLAFALDRASAEGLLGDPNFKAVTVTEPIKNPDGGVKDEGQEEEEEAN